MSDPAKTEEIEDVLSSIRRLVSESGGLKGETRDQQEVNEASQQASQDDAPGDEDDAPVDRLVLTPSLRVTEDENETEDSLRNDDADVSHGLAMNEGNDSTIDETREDDASQAADVDASDEEETQEADTSHKQGNEPEGDVSVEESAVGEDHVGAQEDGENAVSDESNEEAAAELQADEPASGEAGTETDQAGETLKDRIEQLETAVLHSESDWEDDMDGGGDNAPEPVETLQWEDHSVDDEHDSWREADRSGAPSEGDGVSPEGEDAESSDDFDFMGTDDEAVLDEEALREMVADIVRQELQGALGERITRNVRKLVRREIHRALMAQELD